MSAKGCICSVKPELVEVKLVDEDIIVPIPRNAVLKNSVPYPSPKVDSFVYISEDRTQCDYQRPAECKNISSLPQIPGVSAEQHHQLQQEFTEYAELYNCSSLFRLLYIVSYLFNRYDEFSSELFARWRELGVQQTDLWSLRSEFSRHQDMLMESSHYRKAKQLYLSVSEVVFRSIQPPDTVDEEARFAIVWNLFIKVKRAEEVKVWKSGLPRSWKIKAYEVDDGRRLIVLLPNLSVQETDKFLFARQLHIEPMDDPLQKAKEEERVQNEMRRNEDLIKATAGFLLGLLEAAVKTNSSLLSSDTASDIDNFLKVLRQPICSQLLSPAQFDQLQTLQGKLLCCICLTKPGIITLHGQHLMCKDCLQPSIEELHRCLSIFLPSEINCPKCNVDSPLDPNVLGQFDSFFCIECRSSSSLAKCVRGFHCKAHMTKNLIRGKCSTCPLGYYNPEMLAKAREIEYECCTCGNRFPLQSMSLIQDPPCYCLYCKACIAAEPKCTKSCSQYH